jgi:hypothetical protein
MVSIVNSTIRDNNFTGISLFDSNQVTIAYCVIENNGNNNTAGAGIEARWRGYDGVMPIPTAETSPMDRFVVIGNRVRNNNGYGVRIDAPLSMCMANQIESNKSDGIFLSVNVGGSPSNKSTEQCIISHNICRSNGLANIGGAGINLGRS